MKQKALRKRSIHKFTGLNGNRGGDGKLLFNIIIIIII